MIDIRTGDHFRDLTKKEVTMTRGGFIKSILASGIAPSITLGAASLAGSANASGMMRNVGARLSCVFDAEDPKPYDEELEYLESDSHQYIDTGIIPTNNHGMLGTICLIGDSSWGDVNFIGSRTPNERFQFNILSGRFGCCFGAYLTTNAPFSIGNFHEMSINLYNSREWTFDDYNGPINSSITNIPYSITIFAQNMGDKIAWNLYSYRVKKIVITNIESVVMSLVGVLKDGVPCMYDKVGGGFFYNKYKGHQLGYKQYGKDPVAPY